MDRVWVDIGTQEFALVRFAERARAKLGADNVRIGHTYTVMGANNKSRTTMLFGGMTTRVVLTFTFGTRELALRAWVFDGSAMEGYTGTHWRLADNANKRIARFEEAA